MGSNSQPLCSFGDVAVTYRVYILDDLLAEPQEVCHDWGRNLLYVAQRYRQGHAYAPIEASGEISVVDLATAETVGVVDLCAHGYSAPHALELDHDAVYLLARVAEGMVWVDAESRCVTNFADRSQISASFNPSAPASHGPGSSSSSSRRHSGHHGSSRSSSRHSHSSTSSSNGNDRNFIAEMDLRSGKIRQRVMVPDSEQQDAESGLVTFSSPAIRFASRQSSDEMPVVAVEGDPIVAAIRHKFGVKTIYFTSRNVMLI
ncbi:YncE family protein [Apiospora arundinis]|uniref:YncE family protein n=1 Tax=Apiospora arundinis TaxID=335852 RepID=A0ABR2J353_9PEZI